MRRGTIVVILLIPSVCRWKKKGENKITFLCIKASRSKIVTHKELCMTKYILQIRIHINRVKSACNIMEFTQMA